jgi:hypothetical protein
MQGFIKNDINLIEKDWEILSLTRNQRGNDFDPVLNGEIKYFHRTTGITKKTVEEALKSGWNVFQVKSKKDGTVHKVVMEQEMVCEDIFDGNTVRKGWVNKGYKPTLKPEGN